MPQQDGPLASIDGFYFHHLKHIYIGTHVWTDPPTYASAPTAHVSTDEPIAVGRESHSGAGLRFCRDILRSIITWQKNHVSAKNNSNGFVIRTVLPCVRRCFGTK